MSRRRYTNDLIERRTRSVTTQEMARSMAAAAEYAWAARLARYTEGEIADATGGVHTTPMTLFNLSKRIERGR